MLLRQDSDGYDVFDFRVGTLVGTFVLSFVTPINIYYYNSLPDLPFYRNLLLIVQISSVIASFYVIYVKKWANEIGNAFSIAYALIIIGDLYRDGFPILQSSLGTTMLFLILNMFKNKNALQVYLVTVLLAYFLAVWFAPNTEMSRLFLGVTTFLFFIVGYYAFVSKLDTLDKLKNREREIEQSEVLFRGIFDNVPVGIVMLDTQFMGVRFNKFFQKTMGYTEGELHESGMNNLIHTDDFLSRETLAIVKDNTFSTEQRLFTKSGDTILMHVQITPLVVNGQPFRIAMYNDITAERQTQQDLALSAKALKEHNDALEEFSYVISHDLQEPLRMITSFTQIVQRRYLSKINDENANYDFNFVVDGAKRMSTLIRDMLEYSRWSARTLPLTQVDLNDALREAKLNLKVTIDKNKPIIEVSELPVIAANRHMVVQVFQNLISNAIKYRHPERTVHIVIGVEQTLTDYIFSIKDNGMGFEQKYGERIFGIFQRLQTDRSTGNGIGLAICKRTIERQGGRIWVESVLEHGTTFYFTLPIFVLKEENTEDSLHTLGSNMVS
ncbi:MAG: ATP-binding protein [Saprospiraceae bacterium]|nr:ATP-binding protein [Saprospiraceae bacterium]